MKTKPRRKPAIVLTMLGIAVAMASIVSLVSFGLSIRRDFRDMQAHSIDGRPAERLTQSLLSPDGLHRLDAYRNEGKGATVAESAAVIVTALENGGQWAGKDRWSLYFSHYYADITAEWLDNETVRIHNRMIKENEGYVTLPIYRDELFHRDAAR